MKYKTWDSAMQNLERENANLKDQLEKEKKNTRVRFTWNADHIIKPLFNQVLNTCIFVYFGFVFVFLTKQNFEWIKFFVFLETPTKPNYPGTVFLETGRIEIGN